MNVAHAYHKVEYRLKKTFLDYQPDIKRLSDGRAIEMGANFISEFFLFSVAVGVYLGETWRKNKEAQNRKSEVDLKLENLSAQVDSLTLELQSQQSVIQDLQTQQNELITNCIFKKQKST